MQREAIQGLREPESVQRDAAKNGHFGTEHAGLIREHSIVDDLASFTKAFCELLSARTGNRIEREFDRLTDLGSQAVR